MHKIIENCLLILNSQLEEKIKIEKNYTSEQFLIKGNDGKLHQAFINIFINSIQAIQKNGLIIINTKINKNKLIISIADNGSGISQENIKKIFDPFFTTKDAGKGTGLGLSITYGIILDHKGSLEYKSEIGNGTQVMIQLPRN